MGRRNGVGKGRRKCEKRPREGGTDRSTVIPTPARIVRFEIMIRRPSLHIVRSTSSSIVLYYVCMYNTFFPLSGPFPFSDSSPLAFTKSVCAFSLSLFSSILKSRRR